MITITAGQACQQPSSINRDIESLIPRVRMRTLHSAIETVISALLVLMIFYPSD